MARRNQLDLTRWNSAEGQAALGVLAEMFERRGYYRTPAQPGASHRGYECRFSALSAEECATCVALLRKVGIQPGAPFAKGSSSYRIPVYGREVVERLWEAFHRRSSRASRSS
ncbi:MAG TPA: hypothetical protein VGM56_32440 [Byssovorax sp.]|jgi:hypothetical protein